MQAGFQLPDWSRRGFYDRTNFGGTFFFSGLDSLRRTARRMRSRSSRATATWRSSRSRSALYLKDDWQVSPACRSALGLRYDWQNYFHDDNNVAPRVSVAFAPGNKKTNVIRAGVGVFNDRSGPVVIADVLHSQPGGLIRYVVTDPGYPDPFASAAPRRRRRRASCGSRRTCRFRRRCSTASGSITSFRRRPTLSMTYTGARGYHLFRSRDVNAPPPPLYLTRPDPSYGVDPPGRVHRPPGERLAAARRCEASVTQWFNGQMQYTLSRVDNDTSGIASFPANDYDLSGEWARADFDRRHRFTCPRPDRRRSKVVDLGVGLTAQLRRTPYSETLGPDIYNNGRGRARPVGVSSAIRLERPPASPSLDVRGIA